MARYTASLLALAIAVSKDCEAFFNPSLPSQLAPSFNLKNVGKDVPRKNTGCEPLYMSDAGVGDGNGNGDDDDKRGGGGGNLDDFLNPKKASEESENLKRARAALSDTSLPINFDELENINTPDESQSQDESKTREESPNEVENDQAPGVLAPKSIANNPYLDVVSKLSPSDLISKFTSNADPRVQDAVRSTILGLIGTLPQMAFETTTITTGERLASLMFQLQMTGYMFKNAEYRLSLSQSLGIDDNMGKYLLDLGKDGVDPDSMGLDKDKDESLGEEKKIKGKIKVRYGKKATIDKDTKAKKSEEDTSEDDSAEDASSDDSPSMEVEVDAAAYMAELRNEVSKLREDLTSTRQENEEAIRKDLLLYIRTLPQQELNTLTNSMTDDVLGAMKGLVNVVIGGIGEGQIDRNTVTEQSGEAMAQLCMWQLVVGYNLRELEVREEMKNALANEGTEDDGIAQGGDNDGSGGSIDYEEGGFE